MHVDIQVSVLWDGLGVNFQAHVEDLTQLHMYIINNLIII